MKYLLSLLSSAAAAESTATAEPAAEVAAPGFFQTFWEKLGGWPFFLTVLMLVAVGVGLLIFLRRNKGKKVFTTRMLATGAICVALSFVLSAITLFRMPQGGSITPAAMLPMLLFAYTFGPVPALLVSTVYGVLQLIQDAWILSPLQALLDYVIAYMGIALCGFARKLPDKWGYIVGVVMAGLWRYACSVLSGVIFFSEYAPVGQSVWIYSLGYNSVLLIDSAICLVVMMVPQVRGAARRIASIN